MASGAGLGLGSDRPTQLSNTYQVFSVDGGVLFPEVIEISKYQQNPPSKKKTKDAYWQDTKKCLKMYGESRDRIEDRDQKLQLELWRRNFQITERIDHPFADRIANWILERSSFGSDSPNTILEPLHLNSDAELVNSMSSFRSMIVELGYERTIALDCEFYNKKVYRKSIISTIQISSSTKNYVLDALNGDVRAGIRTTLKLILEDEKILKVGSGMREDVTAIQKDFDIFCFPIIDLQPAAHCFIVATGYKCIVCQQQPCQNQQECKEPSYDKIVHHFYPCVMLNKLPQRADWSVRPLHPHLVMYASLDTSVARKIWCYISAWFGQSEPSFCKFIQEVVPASKKICSMTYNWDSDYKEWEKSCIKYGLHGDEKSTFVGILKARDWIARLKNRTPEDTLPTSKCYELLKIAKIEHDQNHTEAIQKFFSVNVLPLEYHSAFQSFMENAKPSVPTQLKTNPSIECSRCHEPGHTMGMCGAARIRTAEDRKKDKERYRKKRANRKT